MTRNMITSIARGGAAAALVAAQALALSAAADDTLALDLNDDAARLTFTHGYSERGMQAEVSLLHHQDNGNAFAVGWQLTGNAASESRPVNAGLGGRLYHVDSDRFDESGQALAVGGFFEAKLPTYDRIRFGGHLYYAPDVLGFGDLEEVVDLSVRATWSVLREGDVYVGLRSLKADYENLGEATIDTGFHVGFQLNF